MSNTQAPLHGPCLKDPIRVIHTIFCYESDDPVAVAKEMDELDLDVIPVVDADQRLIGIFQKPANGGALPVSLRPQDLLPQHKKTAAE